MFGRQLKILQCFFFILVFKKKNKMCFSMLLIAGLDIKTGCKLSRLIENYNCIYDYNWYVIALLIYNCTTVQLHINTSHLIFTYDIDVVLHLITKWRQKHLINMRTNLIAQYIFSNAIMVCLINISKCLLYSFSIS